MKAMKIKYFFLSVLFLSLLSCTKLDETVYDKIPGNIYPETENQIANLSVDAYAQLKPFADDNGWWYLAQEISSDELCGPTRGGDWDDGGKWRDMYLHTWTNDHEGVNRMWGVMWSGITTCNQILDLMNQLPMNEALLKKQKEVMVLRSFYYYLLIDNYGDAPYLTSAANAPQKPLKIKRAAIFDSLVSTIKNALPYLNAGDKKYMATKNMAFALLTKLYLNSKVYTGIESMERLQEALNYCDSVIAGPYSMESNFLAPFLTNNENSTEIIFSIPYDENTFQGFRLHMRTLHYQMNLKYDMTVGPWNGFAVVPDFFDTYQLADKRREGYHLFGKQYDTKGNIIIDGLTYQNLDIAPHLIHLKMDASNATPFELRCTGARVGKYEIKKGAKENLSNDFPLFRITDFYLIKAELKIRLGQSGDEFINPIRTRAGIGPFDGGANALDSLLAERGRELYCEGVRRQDLIRFEKFKNPKWEKPSTDGNDRLIFPIPKWATDANENLLIDPVK
jgi:hypothetical protein